MDMSPWTAQHMAADRQRHLRAQASSWRIWREIRAARRAARRLERRQVRQAHAAARITARSTSAAVTMTTTHEFGR